MTPLSRAFVAVYPPPEIVDRLGAQLRTAGGSDHGLRWTPPDRWHVTLRFVGRVSDPEGLTAALGDAVHDGRAFRVGLGGAGAFPAVRRASVLWVGIDDPEGALGTLAGAVDGACTASGLDPEDRPFRAHMTIVRASRPRDLAPLVAAIGAAAASAGGGGWTVDTVRLMESETRPSGAVHTVVARVGFAS